MGAVNRARLGVGLGVGTAVVYLSVIVLVPLAAVVWRGTNGGWPEFWAAISAPDARAALGLTVFSAAVVSIVNAVMGTLIAWVLVRDQFAGRSWVDTFIDLPFALPTIVAGLVLIGLYGPDSPIHLDLAFSRASVVVALLFVTLPFVVRTVQPALLALDRDVEQAAYSLGASPAATFRRVVLPALAPAIASGAGLCFARAIAEYGATSLISGNIPMRTQVAAVAVYGRIEVDDPAGAAALSTVLLAISFVSLILLDLVRRGSGRRHG